jgi:hypothetical protein
MKAAFCTSEIARRLKFEAALSSGQMARCTRCGGFRSRPS